MSTEVQSPESTPAEAVTAVSQTSPPGTWPQLWQRRRYQISAVLALIAVVAALAANNALSRQYTPDGTVRQYLSALQSGDATSAWNQVQISSPTGAATAALIDRTAFQAALGAGKPDIKAFSINSTTITTATTAIVDFSYDTSSGTKQGKFVVQRSGETHFGLYPVWHLVLTPTILSVAVPSGSNGVTIDGKPLALAGGTKSTVAVLPLIHKIQFTGTQMVEGQTITIDAFFSLGQTVAYQPNLTAAGTDKARAAIKAYFDKCAKQTGLTPTGCPQSVSNPFVGSGQWQLVGDPTQDLSVTFDPALNPAGTGHFQMVFVYQEAGTTGTLHSPSSGAYSAALALAASDITVASISSAAGLPALQRPAAATDQALKDLVVKAFVTCARARAASTADCPQGVAFPGASNVSWKLHGDPISAATVSFDPTSGLFTVQGNFSMTSTYYVQGYPYSRPSYLTSYKAYLFWDGQALKLVTISGDFG